MDYDDLVDQFIVNDGTDRRIVKTIENNGNNKAAETIEHTANKDTMNPHSTPSINENSLENSDPFPSSFPPHRPAGPIKDRNRVF